MVLNSQFGILRPDLLVAMYSSCWQQKIASGPGPKVLKKQMVLHHCHAGGFCQLGLEKILEIEHFGLIWTKVPNSNISVGVY